MGRRPIRTGSMWLALTAAVLATTLSLARPASRAEHRVVADQPRFLGAAFCSSCHTEPGNPAFTGSLEHVHLNESNVWHTDQHSRAYESLTGPRGQKMGEFLGDVTAAKTGCLGCHSASRSIGGIESPPGDAFNPKEGVSCENCHGPSERWIGPHTQHDWRKKSTKEKKDLGMVDLRNPIEQAEACLSCHVGDGKEKVVTHAMFAAGHPLLSSIDVATFGEQMPRHWRYLGEKKVPDARAPFERTRLALVSSALALKAGMTLLAEELGGCAAGVPGGAWPDYARFDCASCHHELVRGEAGQPSPRQKRGYSGPPGRPPLARWSTLLIRASLEALDDKAPQLLEEMGRQEKALLGATHSRPFGSPGDLGKAASEYAEWAEKVADRLGRTALDGGRVRTLLLDLATEAACHDLDYDSARLAARMAWAFYADLRPDPKYDREIVEALRVLSHDLDLGLPDPGDPPARRPGTIEGRLPGTLRAMGIYDAATSRKSFQKIAEALGRP